MSGDYKKYIISFVLLPAVFHRDAVLQFAHRIIINDDAVLILSKNKTKTCSCVFVKGCFWSFGKDQSESFQDAHKGMMSENILLAWLLAVFRHDAVLHSTHPTFYREINKGFVMENILTCLASCCFPSGSLSSNSAQNDNQCTWLLI